MSTCKIPPTTARKLVVGESKVKPGRTVTVTVARPNPEGRTQAFYTGLSVPELLAEIRECVGSVGISRSQTNREIRDRLLPALLELRKKTYRRKPGFYESLEEIGLNADTVRQWFCRSHAAGEIVTMIESESDNEQDDQPTPLPGRDRKSSEELLLEHCDRMAAAILKEHIIHAKKLATEFVRIRDEQPLDPGGVGFRIEDIIG